MAPDFGIPPGLGAGFLGTRFQTDSALPEHSWRLLNQWFAENPDHGLRLYGFDGSLADWSFFEFLPDVRNLSIDLSYAPDSLEPLRLLSPDMTSMGISWYGSTLSLAPVTHFTALESLRVGQQSTDLDLVFAVQTRLRVLGLRSVTLPNLEPMVPLTQLESWVLSFGGTRDLALLGQVGRLKRLDISNVLGLDDISAVGEVATLEYLEVGSQRRVTRLPDMTGLVALREVLLQKMDGLHDLTPLLTAPALEKLGLVQMRRLTIDEVMVLRDHPTLRHVHPGLGSVKKNAAVQAVWPDRWSS